MNTDSQWSKQEAFLHVQLRCGSLSIATQVSHLANEYDVQSKLHGQGAWQLPIKFCVIHEAMNSCKTLKACFENVNMLGYPVKYSSV